MNMDGAALFKEEAAELLADLEQMLLELDGDPSNSECVAKVFRDIHTIKGSGSMFGYTELARFAHDVETVFDKVRSGELRLDRSLLALTLEAKDHIGRLLRSPEADPEDVEASDALLARLRPYLGGEGQEGQDGTDGQDGQASSPEGDVARAGEGGADSAAAKTYLLRYKPSPDTYMTGTDPLLLLDELKRLGRMWVVFRGADIPNLVDIEPTLAFGWWDILLITDKDPGVLRDVFLFVEGDHLVEIRQLRPDRIRSSDVQAVVERMKASERSTFQALFDSISGWVEEKVSQRAARKATAPGTASAASIRVDSARLDTLVNLVGEMVIVQSRLSQLAAESGDARLRSVAEDLQLLASEMRDHTLGIRMVPIGSIYGTLRRLVHDLSRNMGKKIVFHGLGAQTELDKNVIDQLKDPLVHILRNSIDHGVEDPATREASGKAPEGNISIDAKHSGGNIFITISDDGKGIDLARVKAKALEKGLIAPGDALSDKELLALIFAPGFSTAQAVTNVSGRGVGMDVVKKNIESLRGFVEIDSTPGQGCRLTIGLPLTLAIIDGLQVRVDKEFYVLPLSAVEACQERFLEGSPPTVGSIEYKGGLIPCLSLRGVLEIPGEQPGYERIVVAVAGDSYVGLAVDAVVGQQQAVIKPLSEMLDGLKFISGTAVNGDGGVSVILDVPNLVGFAREHYAAQ